ncbi:MAG: RimK family alpha-L-glutamate ligase [Planctomycetaceae bacterium]
MQPIAFLTMDSLADFVAYDQLVVEQLQQAGITVREVSWRHPAPDWNQYSAVIIRSPWDYQADPQAFLAVLEQIEQSSARLLNSLETVRWNIRKSYLRELEQAGHTIVPTLWLESPSASELARLTAYWNTPEVVVKPLIGANADNAFRLPANARPELLQQAAAAFCHTTALAQPFIDSVILTGEYSLIFFNGNYSHAVLKTPKAGDFRVQEEHGGIISSVQPAPDIIACAERCLLSCPQPLLYARTDLVRLPTGQPAIMEVELIEPSLYLSFDQPSAARFASCILTALGKPDLPS